MKVSKILVSLCLSLMAFSANAQDVTLNSSSGSNAIALKTCSHDAGAFCSLIYNGKQFLDDKDHGRQLQSASSFDGLGEAFNPTEAGSFHDGFNPSPSSSKIITLSKIGENNLISHVQMAYWNKVNGVALSNHRLLKLVTVGFEGHFNIIEYTTIFQLPSDEVHTSATFEVLTGYMHKSFDNFYYLDASNNMQWLSPTPVGEQKYPIMFATSDNLYAIGIFSPDTPQPNYPEAGYGRWKFPDVVKWNNVYRISNPSGMYTFKSYVVIGDYHMVKAGLIYLKNKFKK